MTNKYQFFIANWKMFGDFSSIKIINDVYNFLKQKKTKKIKVIFCVPNTLINYFSYKLKKTNIAIGAQNCHHLADYGPYTGSVNAEMVKRAGAKYLILGHSESRRDGDTDEIINQKIISANKKNLIVFFCIGETLKQKNKNYTNLTLSKQINIGLKSIKSLKNIIIAYEPVWAIGSGNTPTKKELTKAVSFIRHKIKKKFKKDNSVKIIYGGSVSSKNIKELSLINGINGFLVGGASQSGKKFIDIIKNYYM